jgi:aryl-alcohol dehydrogenase-like predicted oxidoreductase
LKTRELGRSGLKVSAIGLGCMGMSGFYGPADEQEALATLDRALELGVTFFDTADLYGFGANEELLSRWLKGKRDGVVLATKFGNEWFPDGTTRFNGTPEYCRKAFDASLKRLGVDYIDLYYLHRIDLNVPLEDTIGAMADLVKAGKVGYLGISEPSAQSIRRAHAVHPIAAVQNEYSLFTRDPEGEILDTMRELGVGLVPFAPLGRGFLTGDLTGIDQLSPDDQRKQFPRFQEGNFEQNVALVQRVVDVAREIGRTPAQVALAWVLAQGEDIVPIPGSKRRTHLEENVAAAEIELTEEQLRKLEQALPKDAAAGQRYGNMSTVNR